MSQYAIISGSHRVGSQSSKVSKFIENVIRSEIKGASTQVIELAGNPIPLWDESFWADDPKWNQYWTPISNQLKKADGIIVVAPEWGGMVPPGLKNLFLFCTNQELSHKPGLIVAISAGTGGAYPVNELRTSSYKNTQLCYIPEHIIVRRVENVLNNLEKSASDDDTYIRSRIVYAVKLLEQYTCALKNVRESGVADFKKYPYGM